MILYTGYSNTHNTDSILHGTIWNDIDDQSNTATAIKTHVINTIPQRPDSQQQLRRTSQGTKDICLLYRRTAKSSVWELSSGTETRAEISLTSHWQSETWPEVLHHWPATTFCSFYRDNRPWPPTVRQASAYRPAWVRGPVTDNTVSQQLRDRPSVHAAKLLWRN